MLGFSPNLTSYGPAPKYQKLLLPVPLRANQILPIHQVPDHKLNTIKLHRVLYMYTPAQTHTHRQSQKEHIPDPSVTYFHLTRTEATLYEDFYGELNMASSVTSQLKVPPACLSVTLPMIVSIWNQQLTSYFVDYVSPSSHKNINILNSTIHYLSNDLINKCMHHLLLQFSSWILNFSAEFSLETRNQRDISQL